MINRIPGRGMPPILFISLAGRVSFDRLDRTSRRRGMSRRPCRICHRWFLPDRKVGNRQHVCGNPDCRKEDHRRACARLRREKAESAKRTRLAVRLLRCTTAAGVLWPGTREGECLKITIFLAEVVRQLLGHLRETSGEYLSATRRVRPKVESPGPVRNDCSPSNCKQKSCAQSSSSWDARRDGGQGPAAQTSS